MGFAARRSESERSELERSRAAKLAQSPSTSSRIPCRSDSRRSIPVPKFADLKPSKINFPNTGSSSSQPNTLSFEGLPDKPTPAVEADHSLAFYQATLPPRGIIPVPGFFRQAAPAFVVPIHW